MPSGGGRTDRTPYYIFALSLLVATAAGYYGTRERDGDKASNVEGRVRVLEETIPLRRQMRDQQLNDLSERVSRLERHR